MKEVPICDRCAGEPWKAVNMKSREPNAAIVLAVLVLIAAILHAKPARPVMPPVGEGKTIKAGHKALPDLAWTCQFGTISQYGKTLEITGDASWTASGEIREDGKVRLVWVSGGRAAHALYTTCRAIGAGWISARMKTMPNCMATSCTNISTQ